MLGLDLDINPPFELDNRSKRSIVLDLTTDDGRAVALELLSGADVFVTNIRLGALQRLGLDFESVAADNPRLVYGLITGYGETGPDADRTAYDIAAFWARAGVTHLLTRPGDTPPFQGGGMGDHCRPVSVRADIDRREDVGLPWRCQVQLRVLAAGDCGSDMPVFRGVRG
jgi:crotonobetainyl-CoA:carnitine CoA-transferase CaiB-like acyl-CoA transferase